MINSEKPEYFVRRDATIFFAQPEAFAAITVRTDVGTQPPVVPRRVTRR